MRKIEKSFKKKIEYKNAEVALAVFGEYDNNLKRLEQKNNVQIYSRGLTLTIIGEKKNVLCVADELTLLEKSADGVMSATRIFAKGKVAVKGELLKNTDGKSIRPLTQKQEEYIFAMDEKDLVVAIGPAGTGKTFLACVYAARSLNNGEVERIALTRPVVEAGESLGFLPGALHEKIDPYLRPLYDAFYSIIGPVKFNKYLKENIIEIVPLAYMRGRTLSDAVIILDEAQNTSSTQMQMFLTRIGFNSKIIITGDITQVDLDEKKISGLIEIQEILKNVDDIEFIYFAHSDVMRHHLVKRIVDAYHKFKNNKKI